MGCEDAQCRCAGIVIISPLTIVSVPFYFAILWTLVKFRKTELTGAFFTLTISNGVADLTNLIVNDIFFKLPQYCNILVVGSDFALANSMLVGEVGTFFFWYFNHAQLLGVVMITLNRFTALALPMKHAKIWTDKGIFRAILVMWVLPLLFSLPMFASSITIGPEYDNNQTVQYYLYSFPSRTFEAVVYGFNALYVGIILNIVLFVLYCVQFYKFWRHRRSVQSSTSSFSSNAVDRTEFKLALCGLIFFLVMSCYGFIALLMVFEALGVFRCHLCIHMYNVVGDIFCWINAYLLIILSKSVRKCFVKTFGLGVCCSRNSIEPAPFRTEASKSKKTNCEMYSGDNSTRRISRARSVATTHI